jgi:hypothetical protein
MNSMKRCGPRPPLQVHRLISLKKLLRTSTKSRMAGAFIIKGKAVLVPLHSCHTSTTPTRISMVRSLFRIFRKSLSGRGRRALRKSTASRRIWKGAGMRLRWLNDFPGFMRWWGGILRTRSTRRKTSGRRCGKWQSIRRWWRWGKRVWTIIGCRADRKACPLSSGRNF